MKPRTVVQSVVGYENAATSDDYRENTRSENGAILSEESYDWM